MILKTILFIVPCCMFITQKTTTSFQLPPVTKSRSSLTTSNRYHVGTSYMHAAFPQLKTNLNQQARNKNKLRQQVQKEHPERMCYLAKPYHLYVPQQTLPAYTQTKTLRAEKGRK